MAMYKETPDDLAVVEKTDAMDLEEARRLLHEMIDREYALP